MSRYDGEDHILSAEIIDKDGWWYARFEDGSERRVIATYCWMTTGDGSLCFAKLREMGHRDPIKLDRVRCNLYRRTYYLEPLSTRQGDQLVFQTGP